MSQSNPPSDDPVYSYIMGNQFINNGEIGKARAMLEKACFMKPNSLDFVLSYAKALFLQVDYRRVIEILGPFAKENRELVSLTVEISRHYSFAFLFSGLNIVLSMFFTSMHRAKESILIALSRSFISLMTGLLILPFIFGDRGLWLAVLFAEIVTLILAIILFRRNRFFSLSVSHQEVSLSNEIY